MGNKMRQRSMKERESESVICRLKALRMKIGKHVRVEISRGGLSM